MTEHAGYFSDWRDRAYSCPCGWTGAHGALDTVLFRELMELSCPDCEKHVLLVSFPTDDDIVHAAAEGNAEAVKMLERVRAREG